MNIATLQWQYGMKIQFLYFHLGEDFPSDSDLLEELPEIDDGQTQTNGWWNCHRRRWKA